MKKSHHIDITKPGVSPLDIKKELQDFFIFLLKDQVKHSIIKFKKKGKITKMITNLNTLLQNKNLDTKPYQGELAKIIQFLVSPNIDDSDIRNDSISCFFSLVNFMNTYDKDVFEPIIESLFSIDDKKGKSQKKSPIPGLFDNFVKPIQSEELSLDQKKLWLQIIFYSALPILKRSKQIDQSITKECCYHCLDAITKMIVKCSDANTIDYFLIEDNSFVLFETAAALKDLYKDCNDRLLAQRFYSRIFPCIFYFVDYDMSIRRVEMKDDMKQILQSRHCSGWGGPNLLSSFNSEPRTFFYKTVDFIVTSKVENAFMIFLDPMVEAMCFMIQDLKNSKDVLADITNLYFIIMRLRNVIKIGYKKYANKGTSLIDSSFTCIMMYITQSNPAYREFFPFFLSFYLTIIFDSKHVNVNEVRNFISSIININNINEATKSNIMNQICLHVVAAITIALSTFILDIPQNQSKSYMTNTMEVKNAIRPLSLALMRRITTSNIYFFMQIIGCDFIDIIKDIRITGGLNSFSEPVSRAKSAFTRTESIIVDNFQNTKNEPPDSWTKEKASEFLLNLIEAIDSNIGFLTSATIADVLITVFRGTTNANPSFIFNKLLPILFYNALYKKPDLHVFIPVLFKIVKKAYNYQVLNKAMAYDWFRVIQKYSLEDVSKDIKIEILFSMAQSIVCGFPMSLSMIPIFVTLFDYIVSLGNNEKVINHISFKKNFQLVCSCLVQIITISRNNPLFSHSQESIDASLKKLILTIFDNHQEFAASFERILMDDGGLKRKCIVLLNVILTKISDLNNVENIILILLFSEITDNNSSSTSVEYSYIESMVINNLIKNDHFVLLSSEFYRMMSFLLWHFESVQKKFPNLLTAIVHSISMALVGQKEVPLTQCKYLLRFITNLALMTNDNNLLIQCLNIISMPTNNPERKMILDKSFDRFVLSNKKRLDRVDFKHDNMFLLSQRGTIFSLNFSSDNIVSIIVCNERGLSKYEMNVKNTLLNESNNDEEDESKKLNKMKSQVNFKSLRKFMPYPSSPLMFEIFSETNGSCIKSPNKSPLCSTIVKRWFLRDERQLIESGIVYIGKNQFKKGEFLLNSIEMASQKFYRFLKSIGKLYKPAEIPFLVENLTKVSDTQKNDEAVVCVNSAFHKIVFEVSPLMDLNDTEKVNNRWNRLKEKRFLIFFTESQANYFFREEFEFDGKIEFVMVVRPMKNNLAALTFIQKKMDVRFFGLFRKRIVLPFDLVGIAALSMLIMTTDASESKASSFVYEQYKEMFDSLGEGEVMFKP